MYRFKPDGSGFEYMTGSTNNTWGLGMSETFDVFGSTANNDPSFYVAIPNRYFEGVEGLPMPPGGGRGVGAGYQSAAQFYNAHYVTPYIRQVDVFGGYTAGAGHQLYTARAFPKPVLEPHRVHQRTDGAPGRTGHHREARRRVRDARRLEPARRRRRMGGARAGAGRAGRRRVGLRLVQLHRPAQSDADRLGLSATAPATPMRRRCATNRAAASTASSTATRRRRRSCRCRRRTPRGWSRRCRPTTCCGGCTRSACSSSAGRRTSSRSSSR